MKSLRRVLSAPPVGILATVPPVSSKVPAPPFARNSRVIAGYRLARSCRSHRFRNSRWALSNLSRGLQETKKMFFDIPPTYRPRSAWARLAERTLTLCSALAEGFFPGPSGRNKMSILKLDIRSACCQFQSAYSVGKPPRTSAFFGSSCPSPFIRTPLFPVV